MRVKHNLAEEPLRYLERKTGADSILQFPQPATCILTVDVRGNLAPPNLDRSYKCPKARQVSCFPLSCSFAEYRFCICKASLIPLQEMWCGVPHRDGPSPVPESQWIPPGSAVRHHYSRRSRPEHLIGDRNNVSHSPPAAKLTCLEKNLFHSSPS